MEFSMIRGLYFLSLFYSIRGFSVCCNRLNVMLPCLAITKWCIKYHNWQIYFCCLTCDWIYFNGRCLQEVICWKLNTAPNAFFVFFARNCSICFSICLVSHFMKFCYQRFFVGGYPQRSMIALMFRSSLKLKVNCVKLSNKVLVDEQNEAKTDGFSRFDHMVFLLLFFQPEI